MKNETRELIIHWTSRLQSVTDGVLASFGELSSQKLNFKPAPTVWSIAQILEHLIAVNSTYFPVLKSVREHTYKQSWTAKIPFLPGLFGKMILRSVQPQNLRKVQTFPIWEPQFGTIDSNIIEKFVRHQSEVKDHIDHSADLLAQHQLISSPANHHIVYSLEDAFHIIVTHEERHLGQACRMLTLLQSQSTDK